MLYEKSSQHSVLGFLCSTLHLCVFLMMVQTAHYKEKLSNSFTTAEGVCSLLPITFSP